MSCNQSNIHRCVLMLTLEVVVQLSQIMHSGLTALNLPKKAHNFPPTKVKYNSVVGKAEEQAFIKGIQVQRRTGHRSFVCVLCSVLWYCNTQGCSAY